MRNFAVLHSFLIIYWISLCKTLQSACKTDVNYLYKSLKDFSRTNTDRYLHLENLNSGQQKKKIQKRYIFKTSLSWMLKISLVINVSSLLLYSFYHFLSHYSFVKLQQPRKVKRSTKCCAVIMVENITWHLKFVSHKYNPCLLISMILFCEYLYSALKDVFIVISWRNAASEL